MKLEATNAITVYGVVVLVFMMMVDSSVRNTMTINVTRHDNIALWR